MKRFAALGLVILGVCWMCQRGIESSKGRSAAIRDDAQRWNDSMRAERKIGTDSANAAQAVRDSIRQVHEDGERVAAAMRQAVIDSQAAVDKIELDSLRLRQDSINAVFARRDSLIAAIRRLNRRPPR
jgi:histidinol dehydrogenase